jgi:hypothetical protein
MALDVVSLLCLFIAASNIFMLKKDVAKQHCDNVGLNIPNNASLAVYRAAVAEHWLVMGLKTDNSHVDARLSKMQAAVKNIHHKLAPSLYECFYNTLTICSTFNVDTIIDMMLR